MANQKIPIDGLADAIAKELAAYNQEVTDGMKDAVKEAAKECTKQIKQNSPVLTGSYRKGWTDKRPLYPQALPSLKEQALFRLPLPCSSVYDAREQA